MTMNPGRPHRTVSFLSALSLFSLVCLVRLDRSTAQEQEPTANGGDAASSSAPFDDCDTATYYPSDLLSSPPTRAGLRTLLRRTHRRELPYTDAAEDDVWKALLDLGRLVEAGDDDVDDDDTVRLLYTQRLLRGNATLLRGQPDGGWNREHVWPQSRGVGTTAAAVVDLHHVYPADWNVNSARGNRFFGRCPTTDDDCRIPAHVEAAADTAASSTTFLPPAAARGRIARAVLYVAVRYGWDVTDCPLDDDDDDDAVMAYRSQLLEWHVKYDVTDAERVRNRRICRRWQGNRNPFVDHPEWVESLFGMPRDTSWPYDCSAEAEDDGPDPTPTNASCPVPGSIMIIGANTDNPDAVAMVALVDIPAGTQLYLTDNAWNAATRNFRTNEGTLVTALTTDVAPGTVGGPGISGDANTWEAESGSFALAAAGDTLLLYCRDENGHDDDDEMHFIAGLSLAGTWQDEDDTAHSALPETLPRAAVVTLTHVDNARYQGPTVGSAEFLQAQIVQSTNWQGSNVERFVFTADGWNFQVLVEGLAPNAAAAAAVKTWAMRWVLTVLLWCGMGTWLVF